jgi:hypothetical protein
MGRDIGMSHPSLLLSSYSLTRTYVQLAYVVQTLKVRLWWQSQAGN